VKYGETCVTKKIEGKCAVIYFVDE